MARGYNLGEEEAKKADKNNLVKGFDHRHGLLFMCINRQNICN